MLELRDPIGGGLSWNIPQGVCCSRRNRPLELPGARRALHPPAHLAELPAGPLVVMCGHGERAMSAASILERAGRADVALLDGGPAEWVQASGRPLETGR